MRRKRIIKDLFFVFIWRYFVLLLKTKNLFSMKDGTEIINAARINPAFSPQKLSVKLVMTENKTAESKVVRSIIKRFAARNFIKVPF